MDVVVEGDAHDEYWSASTAYADYVDCTDAESDIHARLQRLRFPVISSLKETNLSQLALGPITAGVVVRVVIVDGALFPSTVSELMEKAVYPSWIMCRALVVHAVNMHAVGWKVCDPRTAEGRAVHARIAGKLRAEVKALYPTSWRQFAFREVMHCCGAGPGSCGGPPMCPESGLLSESVPFTDNDVVIDIPLMMNAAACAAMTADACSRSCWAMPNTASLNWTPSLGLREAVAADTIRIQVGVRHCAYGGNTPSWSSVCSAPGMKALAFCGSVFNGAFRFPSHSPELLVQGRVNAVTCVPTPCYGCGLPSSKLRYVRFTSRAKQDDEPTEVVLFADDATEISFGDGFSGHVWAGPKVCAAFTMPETLDSDLPPSAAVTDVLKWASEHSRIDRLAGRNWTMDVVYDEHHHDVVVEVTLVQSRLVCANREYAYNVLGGHWLEDDGTSAQDKNLPLSTLWSAKELFAEDDDAADCSEAGRELVAYKHGGNPGSVPGTVYFTARVGDAACDPVSVHETW